MSEIDLREQPVITEGLAANSIIFGAAGGRNATAPQPIALSAIRQFIEDDLVGPPGPQGEVGPTGPTGPQGETGATGAVGMSGPGLEPKASVAAATTGNIVLSGEQTIDGVAVVTADRVLAKDQDDPAENGIYIVDSGAWTRAVDMGDWDDVPRALVSVLAGDVNADTTWVCTSGTAGIIDTTEIAWSRLPVIVAPTYRAVWAGPYSRQLIPGDNSAPTKAANKAAIQAVMDAALANGVKTIKLPAGTYWCNDELGLGASGPDQKSLWLKGSGGGAAEPHNTILQFAGTTTAALVVGNGQFMQLSDLTVQGATSWTSRAVLTGVGIGFNHNTHQIRCDNVRVVGFRTCFQTGYNGDVLCDSTSFFKCSAVGYIGWHFSQTQNYVNSLYDCVGNCKMAVVSDVAKAVNIFGGNFSTSDGLKQAFTIGSISALSDVNDNNGQLPGSSYTNATFTAVLSSPDQVMQDGAYDAFAVNTDAFGPIPLLLTNWDSGTSTATFTFQVGWLSQHFNIFGSFEFGDGPALLQAAVQAATTLYACEQITPFTGFCLNVNGVHIENPGSLTRLYHQHSGFGGDTASCFNRITFNYSIDQGDLHGGAPANEAVFMCQQVHPFLQLLHSAPTNLEISNIATALTSNRVIIDVRNDAGHRMIVRNCDLRPNIRVAFAPGFGWFSTGHGWGEWDVTPFRPDAPGTFGAGWQYLPRFDSAVAFRGYFPAGMPMISTQSLADIQDGLGGLGSYTPLCGGIPYRVDYGLINGQLPPAPTDVQPVMVRSLHSCFSYGQAIAVNWAYVGGTKILRLDDTSRMFAGLKIILDNGGGDVGYVVTGVYPTLGFVTVAATFGNPLSGTVGDDYSGATVKQEAYDIRAGVS